MHIKISGTVYGTKKEVVETMIVNLAKDTLVVNNGARDDNMTIVNVENKPSDIVIYETDSMDFEIIK